jgi:hypothetical protein
MDRLIKEVRFARDSPLGRRGFEPPVPGAESPGAELRGDRFADAPSRLVAEPEWRHETAAFLVSNLVLIGGLGRRYNRRVSDGTTRILCNAAERILGGSIRWSSRRDGASSP